ncbi:MAG TPA: hypothetical protein VHP38_07480 [Ruminiclostridium sp.]|nr:hypothetical protein [Ruminiclostridium sp.]
MGLVAGTISRTYIVRALFSQERMIYVPEQESTDAKTRVIYEGKTSKSTETFLA